ncbi:MAG: SUMF1/EgtB/PvdO family nonheme iron enzyme, partial [Mariniphaga sp.]
YELSGNVWEWCWDWMEKDWNYDKDSMNNPVGAKSGAARVNRGGSWIHNAARCRSDARNDYAPDDSYSSLGFRLVFVP